MPRCELSTISISGYPLVLEQARLPVVSYPFEWTYGMLRDAAIRILQITQIAHAHGWEMKDTHGFNVVFDGSNPMWIDVGSFVPRPKGAEDWVGAEDFARFYEYPLRIWRDGGGFLARRLLAVAELMSHSDYGLYRWPWLRLFGLPNYQKLVRRWYQLGRIGRLSDSELRARLSEPAVSAVRGLAAARILPASDADIEKRIVRLKRPRRRSAGSIWSEYQLLGEASVATPRFRRIVELLRVHGAHSVVELGGNEGWCGETLLREGVVQSAISTDSDEIAVDRGYERVRTNGSRLNLAVLDFISPMINPSGGEPPDARFHADVVLALAVTHHLLLTQRVSIERMFRIIGAYGERLVFIEFMPLGLWDGRTAPPLPAWYTLSWFRESFSRRFDILHEEILEKNRHLFIGRQPGDFERTA